MEVKINREIRNYTESMFFGLSLRQFVFSLLAVGVAVLLYFVLKPYVGTETVSWMCILGAAPFAAMGFVNYNGMTAEQFVWAWLRSEMLNRVTLNWKKGKRTHVFIDEFHVVFENEFSAQFFNSAWRQFRKRNAYPTAITQNVEYLLDSVQASTMLSNSEFVVMLNQAASDRGQLAKLLNISNEQMSYITNADAGCGLIKYGSALVPFINRFPQNTKLYQLMTTRPGEGKFARGRD